MFRDVIIDQLDRVLRKLRIERLSKENDGQPSAPGGYSRKKYQPAIQFGFGNGVLLELL